MSLCFRVHESISSSPEVKSEPHIWSSIIDCFENGVADVYSWSYTGYFMDVSPFESKTWSPSINTFICDSHPLLSLSLSQKGSPFAFTLASPFWKLILRCLSRSEINEIINVDYFQFNKKNVSKFILMLPFSEDVWEITSVITTEINATQNIWMENILAKKTRKNGTPKSTI